MGQEQSHPWLLDFLPVLGQASEALLHSGLCKMGLSLPSHGLPTPASSEGYLTPNAALQGARMDGSIPPGLTMDGGRTQHPTAAAPALLSVLHCSPPLAAMRRRNGEQHPPFSFSDPSSGLRDSREWCELG